MTRAMKTPPAYTWALAVKIIRQTKLVGLQRSCNHCSSLVFLWNARPTSACSRWGVRRPRRPGSIGLSPKPSNLTWVCWKEWKRTQSCRPFDTWFQSSALPSGIKRCRYRPHQTPSAGSASISCGYSLARATVSVQPCSARSAISMRSHNIARQWRKSPKTLTGSSRSCWKKTGEWLL